MHNIKVFGKSYRLPSCWEELSSKQLIRIGPALLYRQEVDSSNLYLVLRLLLPIYPKVWVDLSDESLAHLISLLEWVKEPPRLRPLRLFRLVGRGYWLPSERKLSAFEFAVADNHLRAYLQSGSQQNLDMLVACLCRPRRWWISLLPIAKTWVNHWDGDHRIPYNSGRVNEVATRLQGVHEWKKLLVVFWFLNISDKVLADYSDLFSSEPVPGQKPGNWIDAFYSIAETGVFGDFDKTASTSIYNLLSYLRSRK